MNACHRDYYFRLTLTIKSKITYGPKVLGISRRTEEKIILIPRKII